MSTRSAARSTSSRSTPRSHHKFSYGRVFGDQGRPSTAIQASGTFGKLSGIIVHGVQGTYGVFSPTQIAQTGAIADGNLTTANLQGIVDSVSANYKLNNDLAKIHYALSPATSLTLTALSATSWDDKTGNGDNNFSPPQYVAYTEAPFLGKGGCAATQVPIITNARTRLHGTERIRSNRFRSRRRRIGHVAGTSKSRLRRPISHADRRTRGRARLVRRQLRAGLQPRRVVDLMRFPTVLDIIVDSTIRIARTARA